jgi:glycopeptide antibiotics resistance protein
MKYLIDIIALIVIYKVYLYKKWSAKGKDVLAVRTLFYIYIGLVLYVTLMPILFSIPFIFNHAYVPMHMVPFEDYIKGWGDTVRQILLNVVMMIPFGILMPVVKKRKLLTCTLWTFLFSLSIELLQPLLNSSRSSDITDLITNTAGGVIGYLIYLALRPLINSILCRLKSNDSKM